MRFFEDIAVGDRTELGSHTFDAEAIKAFARKYDPQPFHVDEASAKHSHFGRLIASGWHTAAVCMRFNVDAKNREDAALRAAGQPVAASGPSPGVRDVRWLKPVYPGDTVTFVSEIIGKRETSRPGYGLISTATVGTNQHGEPVYTAQGAVFVQRKPT